MDKYMKTLQKSALFAGIEPNDISSLLCCIGANIVHYNKGNYVLRQGDHINDIALLLDGILHIQNDDFWGNRSILRDVSAGEIFGEAYIQSGSTPIINDVVAVENCTIMFLNAGKILSSCSSACCFHTQVIQNMFFIISQKNRILVQKLSHLAKRSTREKLLSYLSQESIRQNNSNIIIPFNRQQLADFLAVDRSAMSNELCKMRDEGLITFHKNSFNLL